MHASELAGELEKCHEGSYGWALQCCGYRADDAADVLQTVYAKVLEGKAQYDGRSAFRTWLFAVIHRTAADERRRNWLRRGILLRMAGAEPATEPTIEHAGAARRREADQAQSFRQAIARLAKRQQEVMHLVFYEDMTLEQAAAAMGITVGSARQHYHRGKLHLARALGRGVEDASGGEALTAGTGTVNASAGKP